MSQAAVSLSQVLASLSRALDLTEGQPEGHTLRSCAIGMRLGESLGLGSGDRSALYYALLLKDAGCSSNAERFANLFGAADQTVKYRMKFADWHKRFSLALRTASTAGLGGSLSSRISHFVKVARTENLTREMIRIRCDRGAGIALQLGFPEETAEAIRCLDEHWCGLGYPDGRVTADIPMLARITSLAQTAEIFLQRDGVSGVMTVLRDRRGTWFQPELVDEVLSWRSDSAWWADVCAPDIRDRVVEQEPADQRRLVDDDGLNMVAGAFADIVDAKSPFTFRHSTNVALYARGIASEMGLSSAEQLRLYRAGLLHDIGKLGVSSRILEKPAALTSEERSEIERHPIYSWEILSRVEAFSNFARIASLHHEKLDGSGYPWGVGADELEPAARILVVADIFEAITATRPYRSGLSPADALAIIRKDEGVRLCSHAISGLDAWIKSGPLSSSADSAINPT